MHCEILVNINPKTISDKWYIGSYFSTWAVITIRIEWLPTHTVFGSNEKINNWMNTVGETLLTSHTYMYINTLVNIGVKYLWCVDQNAMINAFIWWFGVPCLPFIFREWLSKTSMIRPAVYIMNDPSNTFKVQCSHLRNTERFSCWYPYYFTCDIVTLRLYWPLSISLNTS